MDFERNEDGWKALSGSGWSYGRPTGGLSSNDARSWYAATAPTAAHQPSYLYSPIFTVASGKAVKVGFEAWYSFRQHVDGMVMEYSTDGLLWKVLGGVADGWYDSELVSTFSKPGWSGTSDADASTLSTHAYVLPSHTESREVYFRLGIFGNGAGERGLSSVSVDDVSLSYIDRDLVMSELVLPGTYEGELSIPISLLNGGSVALSDVTMFLDDRPVDMEGSGVVDNKIASMAVGATEDVVVKLTILGGLGNSYTLSARVSDGQRDDFPENNEKTFRLLGLHTVDELPYEEDFDGGGGDWSALSAGGGGSVTWQLGSFETSGLPGVDDGALPSRRAWTVKFGSSSDATAAVNAYLYSPVFDIPDEAFAERVTVGFKLWYLTRHKRVLSDGQAYDFLESDGLNLEISEDGFSWRVLGDVSSGWYNTKSVEGLGGRSGWSGSSSDPPHRPDPIQDHFPAHTLSLMGYRSKRIHFRFHYAAPENDATTDVSNAAGVVMDDFFLDINFPPTAIDISKASVLETARVGTRVGFLSSTDRSISDEHTYTLLNHKNVFRIKGSALRTAKTFSVSDPKRYTVRIKTVDSSMNEFTGELSIRLGNSLQSPSKIKLTPKKVNENQPVGTRVGAITVEDPTPSDTHTIEIIEGGDKFVLSSSGDELLTKVSFKYAAAGQVSRIVLRATDASGYSLDAPIGVRILNVNERPTDLSLSNASVKENAAIGFTVGSFSVLDPDPGDSHTYTVSGTDAAFFRVQGPSLKLKKSLDYDDKRSLEIDVQANDTGGLDTEVSFTIMVEDVDYPPTAIRLLDDEDMVIAEPSVEEGSAVGAVVGALSAKDRDAGDTHRFWLKEESENFEIVEESGEFILKAKKEFSFVEGEFYVFVVVVEDSSELTYEERLRVAIRDVNQAPEDIFLSKTSIRDGTAAGVEVAQLSALDHDEGDFATFILKEGGDSSFFEIDSGTGFWSLKTRKEISSSEKSSYRITIEAVDRHDLRFEKAFEIETVGSRNNPPTDVAIVSAKEGGIIEKEGEKIVFLEGQKKESIIGRLVVTDPDEGEDFNYELVGVLGRANFKVDDFREEEGKVFLRSNFVFSTSIREEYEVRIKVEDLGGNVLEKAFVILIRSKEDPLVSLQTQGTLTWRVYPNPASARLHVSLSSSGGRLQIRDLLGRSVYRGEASGEAFSVDISFLRPGVYLVEHVSSWGKRSVLSFVKE